MMIFTIAARELRSLFLSPLAWAILTVVQTILAYFFLLYLDYYVQIQPKLLTATGAPGLTNMVVSPLFATTATVLLIVTPMLTMRLISEERRNRTLSLLLSAPVSATEIILGKFLGVLGFLYIILLLVILMPLSLLSGSSLDGGLFFSGVLGLGLLLASYAALGLFLSTLTDQPAVAGICTFGILLLLWILNLASTTGGGSPLFDYLSMLTHYQSMVRGIFNSADFIYYLLFVVLFLSLSIRRMNNERLQG